MSRFKSSRVLRLCHQHFPRYSLVAFDCGRSARNAGRYLAGVLLSM
jgi:hypothetical protein